MTNSTGMTDLFKFSDHPHDFLCKEAVRWLLGKGSRYGKCKVAAYEVNTLAISETPDAIGFSYNGDRLLVECKVSRSDFLRDKKKSFRKDPGHGIGCFRYYLVPEGLVAYDEIPDRWGLIYRTSKGLKMIKRSSPFPEVNRRAEIACMVKMLRSKEYEFLSIIQPS